MDDFFNLNTSGNAVCEDCGEPLSPDATFCPNCGSRRVSKHAFEDTELPFQYVTPRIQNESYAAFEPEEEFSLGYDADDYGAEDYDTGEFVTEDYGDDFSDYMETMSESRREKRRPEVKKRPVAKKPRRERDQEIDDYPESESRKPAIAVLIAGGFLAIVLVVSLLGFIVSLFSGNGSGQTIVEDNSGTSSVTSSAVSSDVSSEAAPVTSSSSSPDKKVVHLLPEEVTNESYTKFTVENNTFTTVMASSFIDAKLTHGSTDLAFDGDYETSWQDGVKGYGVGEWLLAYNSDGSAVKVSEITVYNGYQNPKFNTAKKDMYLVNSRVSDFTITFDDGTSESFTLEDIKEPQTFKFKARETCYIRFTVGGAYKGTKYKDTCIGEIIYK